MNFEEVSSKAKRLAESVEIPSYIFFTGPVGVGKTFFIKKFVEAIDSSIAVSSPTYSIVNEYKLKDFKIVHVDAYRVGSEKDLESIGFFNFIQDKKIILLVEWSELIKKFVPKNHIVVNMKYINENSRSVEVLKCTS